MRELKISSSHKQKTPRMWGLMYKEISTLTISSFPLIHHHSQFCLKTGEAKQWVSMAGIKKYLLFFIPKKIPLNAITFDVKIEDSHLWLKPN